MLPCLSMPGGTERLVESLRGPALASPTDVRIFISNRSSRRSGVTSHARARLRSRLGLGAALARQSSDQRR